MCYGLVVLNCQLSILFISWGLTRANIIYIYKIEPNYPPLRPSRSLFSACMCVWLWCGKQPPQLQPDNGQHERGGCWHRTGQRGSPNTAGSPLPDGGVRPRVRRRGQVPPLPGPSLQLSQSALGTADEVWPAPPQRVLPDQGGNRTETTKKASRNVSIPVTEVVLYFRGC